MDMKITGGIEYSAHDGDLYELEAYLPDEEVYVGVQHYYHEWRYCVTDKSTKESSYNVFESYDSEKDVIGSEHEDTFKTLEMMIRVMEMANR